LTRPVIQEQFLTRISLLFQKKTWAPTSQESNHPREECELDPPLQNGDHSQ
jgi:hypothetical protein